MAKRDAKVSIKLRKQQLTYLYGHMKEVSVIQAGFHCAVLITATANVRVR